MRKAASVSLTLGAVLFGTVACGAEMEGEATPGLGDVEPFEDAGGATSTGGSQSPSSGGHGPGAGGQPAGAVGSTAGSGGESPEPTIAPRAGDVIEPRTGDARLWKEFVEARRIDKEPTLPDFSYAGYKYSETPPPDTSDWPVFRVGDYGAKPDDGKYDDVGIQAAIDAAEAKGSGVVLFESGRYKLSPNESTDEDQRITLAGSNILLKGHGSGAGGTELFVDKMKLDGGGWPMFVIGAAGEDQRIERVTTLKGLAERESFVITVEDASSLKAGQSILLWTVSTELRDDQLGGLPINEQWEGIQKKGVAVREHHAIASISGNQVTLREPLHITLKESYDVSVRSVGMIEEVGIEDIRFTGNWPSYGEDFIHHKPGDKVHDYGWTCLKLEFVRNAWIDRVEFKDFNQNLSVRDGAAITVSNVRFSGKKGHASSIITQSYGVLVKDSEDTAGHHHGAGVAQRNSGAVYLRYKHKEAQRIDAHGGAPFASLFDNMSHANLWGSGGSIASYPNHLKYFVFWNFEVEGGPDFYDFWAPKRAPNTFLMPYFIGLYGKNVTLKQGTYAANDSQGKRVQPESLFEAQLALRNLPGFHYCCKEGSTRTFEEPVDIAYGTQGKYVFKRVSGEVKLDKSTFGDPVPGQKKLVFYRPVAASL